MNPMEAKGLKILVHASAFFAPFLVPFVVYLVSSDLQVKRMSVQALLFQLVMGVLITVSFIMSFLLIGIPFLIGFGLMTVIIPIIAIVKAINDEPYNYPIVGRWF